MRTQKVRKRSIKSRTEKSTNFSLTDWKFSTIILGSVNIYAAANKNIYPAELALLKFNVANGIIEKLNIHISSSGLPIGLLNEAVQLAEETHKIAPDEKLRLGEYKKIEMHEVKKRIKNFLGTQDVIFSFDYALNKYDDIEATAKVLKKIIGIKEVAVASMQHLLLALQKRNEQPPADNLNLRAKLENNQWEDWSFGCMHHFHVDAPKYCTLARVKRWAYKICCLILPQHEIKMGTHSPDPLETEPCNVTQRLLTLDGDDKVETDEVTASNESSSSYSVDNDSMLEVAPDCREKYKEAACSLPIVRPFAVVAPYSHDSSNELLPFDFDSLMLDESELECQTITAEIESPRAQEYTTFDFIEILKNS